MEGSNINANGNSNGDASRESSISTTFPGVVSGPASVSISVSGSGSGSGHSAPRNRTSISSLNNPSLIHSISASTPRKLGANGLPRRRNGKQQACEPCRKAKIACDHALPVCERCRKRRVEGKCVYVDAPMTRVAGVGVDGEREGEEADGERKGSREVGVGAGRGMSGMRSGGGVEPIGKKRRVNSNFGVEGDEDRGDEARRGINDNERRDAARDKDVARTGMYPYPGVWDGNGRVNGSGNRNRNRNRNGSSVEERRAPPNEDRNEGEYGQPNPESGPFIKSGGFFGPTNFSAVFLENQHNLGPDNEPLQISTNPSESYVPSYESLQPQTFLMLSACKSSSQRVSPRIALGANVLHAFPNRATCQFLLDRFTATNCTSVSVFPKESIVATASSLWATFPCAMRFPRRASDLDAASTALCANAEKALEEKEDYAPWLASVTGRNLRWEVVGQVYAAFASSVLSLGERDPFFGTQEGERRDRRRFAVEMKECVQACVTLSNFVDLINLPMVALLVKNLVLQTVISGDACLVVWRQLGDLVSAATALGLHRQPLDTSGRPTFLTEMKRRMITAVLHFNLVSSLLMGRPPALSHRSTRFQLPHAISDEALMQGGEQIAEAIERLDENGWAREGEGGEDLKVATMMRAKGLMSKTLNEILDLYLGEKEDCTSERIGDLMARITHTYASLPTYLHFHLSDLSRIPDISFLKRLTHRLQTLEHRLLLERLAHKHGLVIEEGGRKGIKTSGNAPGQSMVDCAREMLELTVLLWVQRDRFEECHCDYDWMLMCWGVPSSGVLCVELLKEIKERGNNSINSSGVRDGRGGGEERRLRLPRSEIVQNLSLLIGFLDWIKPAAGNYQLCLRMRVIIKRILDQILNPASVSSGGGGGSGMGVSAPESAVRELPVGVDERDSHVSVSTGNGSSSEGLVGEMGVEQVHSSSAGDAQMSGGQYDPALFQQHHDSSGTPAGGYGYTYPTTTTSAPTISGGFGGANGVGGMEGEVENFDWLMNVDWSRGPWIDLGQDLGQGLGNGFASGGHGLGGDGRWG